MSEVIPETLSLFHHEHFFESQLKIDSKENAFSSLVFITVLLIP